ncbi:MAG TPA: dihydroxyacetone kinase subunit DhaL [Ktedonobacteraceae bacterium]|jgi:dihydroxyacetone kinase-like protein|nr:dihydroxyacetone kinase subunit DhaL [Ktedonobacteraceae bacterium]
MEHSSLEETQLVVKTIAQAALDNEKYFGDLDAVVGDGDFGYSLARGFEKLLADWDTLNRDTIGTFLKQVSIIITSRIGGTSGPIWGTAFLRAATTIGDKQELGEEDVVAMLRAAIEGIKKRGQTDLGDKTLLDSLIPAVDQLERSFNAGADGPTALKQAAQVARERAEATRELVAKRGRASYSGERSIGTLDAGAVAVAVMFEQVSSVWTQQAVQQ